MALPQSYQHFRFFDLPLEIRAQILNHVLLLSKPIDRHMNVNLHDLLLNTLLVSKQFSEEAAFAFYSRNVFRILPTHPRAAAENSRPLLWDLSGCDRPLIRSLELRLGPYWMLPPKCWEIDGRLGLEEVVLVRVLRVYIEVDPSAALWNGFRSLKVNYADLSVELLRGCIDRLPSLAEIQFDAPPTVSRKSDLLTHLVELAQAAGKRVTWGPEQQALDCQRPGLVAEADAPVVDLAYETLRQGMIPFYSSSPLYRNNASSNVLLD